MFAVAIGAILVGIALIALLSRQRPSRRYYALDELVAMIDEPHRAACRRILEDHRELFSRVQGSTHNHQAWPGGYQDHVTEAMNIAVVLYGRLHDLRALPFSLSDALLVMFLHDIEKPWKYEIGPDGQPCHKPEFRTKAQAQAYRERRLFEYGIRLSEEQMNGLVYVEGEMNDYSNRRRVMGPLAAFCHLCDVTSARIWHAFPAVSGDSWTGAKRVRPQD
jgi:hypothetical protein